MKILTVLFFFKKRQQNQITVQSSKCYYSAVKPKQSKNNFMRNTVKRRHMARRSGMLMPLCRT